MPSTTLPARRLFDLHDAGMFNLPTELLELRTAFDRLSAATRPRPASEAQETQALIADTITAARTGAETWPTPDGVLAARRHAEAADVLTNARQTAAATLAGDLSAALVDAADVIVRDHLRPVHDDAVDAVRAALAVTDPHGDSEAAMLRAPAPVRKAWLSIDAHVDRYTAVALARTALQRLGYRPARDVDNEFSKCKNMHLLWPRQARYAMGGSRPPWPTDARGQLLWFVRHNAELWCPTAAEQDAHRNVAYAEADERQARARYATQAVHAWAGAR